MWMVRWVLSSGEYLTLKLHSCNSKQLKMNCASVQSSSWVCMYCLPYNHRHWGNCQWPTLQKSCFKKVGVGYRTFEIRYYLSPKLVPCPKILNPKPQPQINTANLKLQRRVCLERIVLHPNFCIEDHCQIPNVCTFHIFLPPKKRIRMRGRMRL